ncbi:hypothetical protein M153_6010003284 [Pseudoloma neurophilia]|uniref:Uncharacterized protein n=1 Tax=Pseudoloma neurophilia TaxID=146866 RepID=A0A0R0LWL1_9MICR|nr:hypothetical protein M153_6010003284 [Pseudoloma neurophilia]
MLRGQLVFFQQHKFILKNSPYKHNQIRKTDEKRTNRSARQSNRGHLAVGSCGN